MKITKKEAGFYVATCVHTKSKFYIQSPQRTETGFWVIIDVTNSFGLRGQSPVFCKTLRECKDHLRSLVLYYEELGIISK